MISARAHLVDKLRTDGPFDGVIAISDGAALAATVMIHDANLNYHGQDGIDPTPRYRHFRFAIFIAPFPPYDSTGRKRLDIRLAGSPQIHCPTIHIVGNFDPFLSVVRLTQGLCDSDKMAVIQWDGQHSTPGSSERPVCRKVASKLKEALQIDDARERTEWTDGTNRVIDGELNDSNATMVADDV